MHRGCELLVALALASGCNQVFGLEPTVLADGDIIDAGPVPPDRDRDGIVDAEDPCIAGIADYKTDLDFDGWTNEMDSCPFDFDGIGDSDQDTLDDLCDPLWSMAGDRRRCFMAFQNATLNLELWVPRAGEETAWRLIETYGLLAMTTGTVVAAESLEAPVATSYDVPVGITAAGATEVAATLWLRTTETASATDLGCELRGTATTTRLTVKGSEPPVTMTFARAIDSVNRLQATVSPQTPAGLPNVRCAVRFSAMLTATGVSASVSLPPGRVGFGVVGTRVVFATLDVTERDAPPPL